eukprot:scaffold1484_cov241-Pinguiococcus_pyrenoidosus.AAC.16
MPDTSTEVPEKPYLGCAAETEKEDSTSKERLRHGDGIATWRKLWRRAHDESLRAPLRRHYLVQSEAAAEISRSGKVASR